MRGKVRIGVSKVIGKNNRNRKSERSDFFSLFGLLFELQNIWNYLSRYTSLYLGLLAWMEMLQIHLDVARKYRSKFLKSGDRYLMMSKSAKVLSSNSGVEPTKSLSR